MKPIEVTLAVVDRWGRQASYTYVIETEEALRGGMQLNTGGTSPTDGYRAEVKFKEVGR